MVGKHVQRRLNRRGRAVKHVHARLSASKHGESCFYYCGSPVNLVQACLWAGNTLQRRFNRRSGAVKRVHACISASKDGESSFHYCGSHVKLVQACLWAGNTLHTHFKPPRRCCEARAGLFKCQKEILKAVSTTVVVR